MTATTQPTRIAALLLMQLGILAFGAWWVMAAQLPWQLFGLGPIIDVALGVLAAMVTYGVAFGVCRGDHAFAKAFLADSQRVRAMCANFTWPVILAVSLLAGVGEELLFRVGMQTALTPMVGLTLAIALTSLAFGLLHFLSWAYLVAASLLALLFGVVYALTQSAVLVMVWHAVHDIIALAVLVKHPEVLGLVRERVSE